MFTRQSVIYSNSIDLKLKLYRQKSAAVKENQFLLKKKEKEKKTKVVFLLIFI